DMLHLTVHGPWFLTIYWEVPLLAMISEIYFEDKWCEKLEKDGLKRLDDKIKINNSVPFKFADFGTRRRFSGRWQRQVVGQLKNHCANFVGTSNVMFAKEFGLTPIGTMAHELFMVGEAIYPLRDFQKNILKVWLDEYEGQLNTALTDTIGIVVFLKDFNLHLSNAYSKLRHDSGDPFTFANKILQHYKKIGIDPTTKGIVFSDGLNFDLASKLHKAYNDKINVSMGIGTNLTHDFDGIIPLQIVIKIVECNGRPVAKISDSPGKGMCRDDEYVKYLKKVFKVV
ncbi:hypothetical protein LCGC14_3060640, partial [marine sediment metagenome]